MCDEKVRTFVADRNTAKMSTSEVATRTASLSSVGSDAPRKKDNPVRAQAKQAVSIPKSISQFTPTRIACELY